jgi:hypothetical protein
MLCSAGLVDTVLDRLEAWSLELAGNAKHIDTDLHLVCLVALLSI